LATPIIAIVCAGKGVRNSRVTSHVVVNCGQFRHGSPLVQGGICGREQENKGKEEKMGGAEG
jgi:hypothetical protein